ncbi:MAG: hypothetical protein Q4E61_03285 [Alphaproteobacteria bacterium]|nr:hypothetical protein [Alphaproteobacteria bacterium]
MKKTPSGKAYHMAFDMYDSQDEAWNECCKRNKAANHPSNFPIRWEYWVEQNPDGKYQIYGKEYNVCDL